MGFSSGAGPVVAGIYFELKVSAQSYCARYARQHIPACILAVMPGLDPGIHDDPPQKIPYDCDNLDASWIAGSSPAMTNKQ
jgi:hypothetical protein